MWSTQGWWKPGGWSWCMCMCSGGDITLYIHALLCLWKDWGDVHVWSMHILHVMFPDLGPSTLVSLLQYITPAWLHLLGLLIPFPPPSPLLEATIPWLVLMCCVCSQFQRHNRGRGVGGQGERVQGLATDCTQRRPSRYVEGWRRWVVCLWVHLTEVKAHVSLVVGAKREDNSWDPAVWAVWHSPSTVGSEHFRHPQLWVHGPASAWVPCQRPWAAPPPRSCGEEGPHPADPLGEGHGPSPTAPTTGQGHPQQPGVWVQVCAQGRYSPVQHEHVWL